MKIKNLALCALVVITGFGLGFSDVMRTELQEEITLNQTCKKDPLAPKCVDRSERAAKVHFSFENVVPNRPLAAMN